MIVQRTPVSSMAPFDLDMIAVHCHADEPWFLTEVLHIALATAQEFENYAQIALLFQTVKVTIEDRILRSMLPLPVAPLIDPLSVSITVDGAPFDDFAVIAGNRPALHFNGSKPRGLVVIEYQAGFGETHVDLPRDIKLAIADQASASFDMRGGGDGKSNGMSPHMARIAARYRRVAV